MSRDGRFWRNVTLIALAHVALIAGLIRWSVEARSSSNAQSIVWLGYVGGASTATEPTSVQPPRPAELSPSPEPSLPKSDEAYREEPLVTAAKSEIELSTPKPTPRPSPKPTPKKTVMAKASPKPSPKAKRSPTKSTDEAEKADANAEKR